MTLFTAENALLAHVLAVAFSSWYQCSSVHRSFYGMRIESKQSK